MSTRSTFCALALAGLGCFAASTAFAADTAPDARYQKESAACASGASNQDKATCMREAGAARQESQRGRLEGAAATPQNTTDRCKALPAKERGECEARMSGKGTTSGSVGGGGVIREVTTPGAPVYPAAKP